MPISSAFRTKVTVQDIQTSYPSWAHPDVLYYSTDWKKLRDTFAGERSVKESAVYIKQPAGMDDELFATYIENATYYNMTARTVGALVGTVFKRNPIIDNLPKKLEEKLKGISIRGQTFRTFSKNAAKEIIHMGRYGILVDRLASGDPYLSGYVTESILDWSTTVVDGRETLSRVVLMEVQVVDAPKSGGTYTRQYAPKYRELVLEDGVYKQKIYKTFPDGTQYPSPTVQSPDEVIIPTNRGKTFNYIPFVILGQDSNSFDIERSPMQDIADMNISHYRSYAQLEHGRFFTGTPVYWVSKGETEGAGEYQLGASTVWEVGNGQKAGLMEFNGHGLGSLEKALVQKEAHIATLGGRVIGVDSQAVSESDNQLAMKDRNESAMLLNVTLSMDEGFSRILQWWTVWQDITEAASKTITVEFNKEFLIKEVAAREFRAIHQMYTDGVLPIEVVYDYLKRADVIPDWMELVEFKKLLDSKNSFPNNPDIAAMKEGFPDAKSKLSVEESEKDRVLEQDLESQRLEQAREAAAASARAAALPRNNGTE